MVIMIIRGYAPHLKFFSTRQISQNCQEKTKSEQTKWHKHCGPQLVVRHFSEICLLFFIIEFYSNVCSLFCFSYSINKYCCFECLLYSIIYLLIIFAITIIKGIKRIFALFCQKVSGIIGKNVK